MNNLRGDRTTVKEMNALNWDTDCNDCNQHYNIANLHNLDLIYNDKTKHIVGVCVK